ncbi:low affinity iron permease family protein [Flavobacterium restrictum]|uniref:Low affinity iron permease family protein n=1 Tax=Flavobacterium restrictum TaxID=2594428 RepID=A0A553DSC8_9FLAO|nr:low affinity iron permease family protein [Flavobacterium restrictum]TRX35681.1 low affinity iron permease family protein [Flavobacterium restrictum]
MKIYSQCEIIFEKLTSYATMILGNPISFILAFIMVIVWWTNSFYTAIDVHQIIGDIIFGVTFLSLFIIQKSFNRFSGSLHLKLNELVATSEGARNTVMNAEEKTEREITELSKEYSDLAEQIIEIEKEI